MNTEKNKELQKSIEDNIAKLAAETDGVRFSEEFQKYLNVVSKFHRYSLNNQLLIWGQNPDATLVAGFKTWQKKFNRHVKKGEHGIAIFAPCNRKAVEKVGDPSGEETLETRVRDYLTFQIAYVFDVSQTEGEPIETIEWKDTAKDRVLEDALLQFGSKLGIQIEFVGDIAGGAEGVSKGGHIQILQNSGTRTLVHELAHELLHQAHPEIKKTLSRQQREIEADSVAYTVCNHFTLPAGNNPNYLALWHATSEDILACMGRVRDACVTLITELEAVMEVRINKEESVMAN